MKYRPEIDGLRSIAVLSVIFYHFRMFHFQGGYLGVDIFFVISGYLISTIIYEEIANTGHLSFSGFWLRRARRILPALFFMLTGTSLLVWWLLSGTSLLPRYAKSLLASIFSVSNILFFSQSGYFDAEALTKPLLHTWSLAVEEQFYLFFPLLMHLFLVKYHTGKRVFLLGLGACAIASCSACFFMSRDYAAFAFYMLPTRFWELLAGSVLAFAVHKQMLPSPGRLFRHGLEFGAMAICGYCLLYAENEIGVWNVLVVAASVVFLYSQHGLAAKVLSRQPFVFIGKLSYSLYLWHWPFFVLLSLYRWRLSNMEKAGLVALTFLLGYVSYRFVEQPFRKPQVRWRQVATRLGPVAAGLCCMAIIGIAVQQTPAFQVPDPSRIPPLALTYYEKDGLTVGSMGSADKMQFLLFGDSHAGCVQDVLFSTAKEYGLTGGVITTSSLFFAPDFQVAAGYQPYSHYAEMAQDFIRKNDIKVVLLAERWHAYILSTFPMAFKGEQIKNSKSVARKVIQETLTEMLEAGVTVFILEQVPDHRYPSLEMAAFFTHSSPMSRHEANCRFMRDLVGEINHPNLHLLRTDTPFLKDKAFFFIQDGKLLYQDMNHINYFGQQLLKPVFNEFCSFVKNQNTNQPVKGIDSD